VVDESGHTIAIDDYRVPDESERHAGREVDKLRPIRLEFFMGPMDLFRASLRNYFD